MAYSGAKIYQLDDSGFSAVRYQDTEHFIVTREFLSNPERMLETLFSDDE
jgi:predicted ATPase